jgi:hypothetical protein
MTLRGLGFTEATWTPGIQYYSKQNLKLNLAIDRAVFSISAQCAYMIRDDILLCFSILVRIDVCKLLFQWIIENFCDIA